MSSPSHPIHLSYFLSSRLRLAINGVVVFVLLIACNLGSATTTPVPETPKPPSPQPSSTAKNIPSLRQISENVCAMALVSGGGYEEFCAQLYLMRIDNLSQSQIDDYVAMFAEPYGGIEVYEAILENMLNLTPMTTSGCYPQPTIYDCMSTQITQKVNRWHQGMISGYAVPVMSAAKASYQNGPPNVIRNASGNAAGGFAITEQTFAKAYDAARASLGQGSAVSPTAQAQKSINAQLLKSAACSPDSSDNCGGFFSIYSNLATLAQLNAMPGSLNLTPEQYLTLMQGLGKIKVKENTTVLELVTGKSSGSAGPDCYPVLARDGKTLEYPSVCNIGVMYAPQSKVDAASKNKLSTSTGQLVNGAMLEFAVR